MFPKILLLVLTDNRRVLGVAMMGHPLQTAELEVIWHSQFTRIGILGLMPWQNLMPWQKPLQAMATYPS